MFFSSHAWNIIHSCRTRCYFSIVELVKSRCRCRWPNTQHNCWCQRYITTLFQLGKVQTARVGYINIFGVSAGYDFGGMVDGRMVVSLRLRHSSSITLSGRARKLDENWRCVRPVSARAAHDGAQSILWRRPSKQNYNKNWAMKKQTAAQWWNSADGQMEVQCSGCYTPSIMSSPLSAWPAVMQWI